MNRAFNRIAHLQDVLTSQLSAYREESPYALLDFPNHPNTGDAGIWLGELALLKNIFGTAPAFLCEKSNFSPASLRKAMPHGPIFLHGGGNFGDIWPGHQQFREFVIEQFPDRRIIQLPQTVHFDDPSSVRSSAALIGRHKNFHLFTRDSRSQQRALSYFDCPVHLAPDMAFCMGAIPRAPVASKPLLFLLRADREASGVTLTGSLPDGASAADWLEEDPGLARRTFLKTLVLGPLKHGPEALHKLNYRGWFFENLARERVGRAINLLSAAQYVITDRLHCHIFCILLGIPHAVLDNSYGKLSTFIETWTKDEPLLTGVTSIDEAIEAWHRTTSLPEVEL